MMITKGHARKLRAMIEKSSVSLDDEDALEAVELFPMWEAGLNYPVDYRLRYKDKLYRVIQAHTSQIGWEPDIAPALFTEVASPGTIPVWKQPTGAQDAYMTGDKVRFPNEEGRVFISIVDYNVWEPLVYGWEYAD